MTHLSVSMRCEGQQCCFISRVRWEKQSSVQQREDMKDWFRTSLVLLLDQGMLLLFSFLTVIVVTTTLKNHLRI